MESFGYKTLKNKSGNPILCEEIGFNDLGSLLYYDFFNSIKQNYVPNRCRNCGKFFLIKGSWYYTYCDRKLRKEPGKTCRDVILSGGMMINARMILYGRLIIGLIRRIMRGI